MICCVDLLSTSFHRGGTIGVPYPHFKTVLLYVTTSTLEPPKLRQTWFRRAESAQPTAVQAENAVHSCSAYSLLWRGAIDYSADRLTDRRAGGTGGQRTIVMRSAENATPLKYTSSAATLAFISQPTDVHSNRRRNHCMQPLRTVEHTIMQLSLIHI